MNYKEIIESRYNREAWQGLLHDIFHNNVKFWSNPIPIQVSNRLAKTALRLGNITLSDGETIAVYEVELNDKVDISRNKRGIRDMLTSDWRGMGYIGAFVFSYRKNESSLRFSYVSETWDFDKDGNYEKRSTDTMRYTYLLGEGRGCRTAIDRFTALKESKQTLSDITAAFSVETLTKLFYKDLFDWYLWAISPDGNISFPNNTAIEEDDREDLEKKIIRMITRIIFVWFIKQKNLVPGNLFDENFIETILKDFDSQSPVSGTYYNAILQNLFFATLNRAIEDENGEKRGFAESVGYTDVKTLYRYDELFSISKEEIISLFSEVPFLNGGLFECLDKTKTLDGVSKAYYYDGFSRNASKFSDGRYRYRAVVPNILFFAPEKGLFSILARYNFTIEENTPEEQQVALDPELLGKVFENLLGAYNPETKETARNQSGSFYTPREIVGYMVDESLIAYLGDTPLHRSLFAQNFKYEAEKTSEYNEIARKLKSVKVIDPACGSGAFPMGMLNRMIDILQRIEPDENTYTQKLTIIENCLYGSDIQSIAVQITKLRFFISLICDCEKDPSKPNFGIPTLPNLETKFVAANSLIGKKRNVQSNLFENPEIKPTKEALTKIRHEHFMAKSAVTKRRLREQDQNLREKLASLLAENNDFAPEDAKQLASWNPYDQNTVSRFFDPEWMFGLNDNPFDIVIGNPPYIQLQNNSGELAILYADCGYKTYARTGDIYCLFYERGWQLLKDGGHLCYITSNKWMRAGYGEKTRDFLSHNTDPQLLIDFAGVKIFESATVDTNILLFSKNKNQHKTLCAVTNKQNKDSVRNLSVFVQQEGVDCDFFSSESWVILSPIEQSIKRKIEAVGTPLKDWDIQINYGIKTGLNDAFIINTEKRDEILANCLTEDERARTAKLIRPILRGRDIKRYAYDWANLYLIATFPACNYDIDKYPAIKQYLLSFAEKDLREAGYDWVADSYLADFCKQKLAQTGEFVEIEGKRITIGTTPEKARKKTNNQWFETQDSISYWEDFFKPKITWGNLNLKGTYSYVQKGMFINAPSPFIVTSNIAILHILNSKIADYYIRLLGVTRNGGYFEYKPMFVEKFPIPQTGLDSLELYPINPSKEQEKEIDDIIYQLYHLSMQEIEYIENRES